jgi:hypothetical protein
MIVTLTHIRDCKRLFTASTHLQQLDSKKQKTNQPVRLVEWHPCGAYQLVQSKQKLFSSTDAILKAYADNTLHCDDFWEFCHVDPKVVRGNKYLPRFLALFKLASGQYIIPQAKHYKQAYGNGQRKDSTKGWDLLENGCPYWCCIYAIRVKNEQDSKKKYQQRQKRVSADTCL